MKKVRKLRFEHGEMIQQAWADTCGITRRTVIALEAGKYASSLELAFRMAHTFEVGVKDVSPWEC